MTEQKQSTRGGVRSGAGRPKGATHQAQGLPEAKRITFRFYPEDLAAIDKLVELGYSNNRTGVLRKAIQDAVQRLDD